MEATEPGNLRELKVGLPATIQRSLDCGSELPGLACDSTRRAHAQRERSRKSLPWNPFGNVIQSPFSINCESIHFSQFAKPMNQWSSPMVNGLHCGDSGEAI